MVSSNPGTETQFLFFFFQLFLLVGGYLLYNIVVVFAIHESAMDLHVFPIPSLWVFPVHQPWALVSCIQPGLVICFILDSILVSMLLSQSPALAVHSLPLEPLGKTHILLNIQTKKKSPYLSTLGTTAEIFLK